MVKRIQVVMIEDHPAITSGVSHDLKGFGIDVVASSLYLLDAATLVAQHRPQVLLLDIRFNNIATTGLVAAKEIIAKNSDLSVVFYSQFDSDEFIREAYRIPRSAFVPKSMSTEILSEAIHTVSARKPFFVQSIAERIAMMNLRETANQDQLLTDREMTVFRLLARGYMQSEIATETGVSSKTISLDRKNIYEKLSISTQKELFEKALEMKVIG